MTTNIPVSEISVLLADDHSLLISGFRKILTPYEIKIVAETGSPTTSSNLVTDLFKHTNPDVTLIDIKFGHENAGLDVVSEILAIDNNAKLIVMSKCDHTHYIKDAYNRGAKSFLTKGCTEEQLVIAIQEALNNEIYILPDIAQKIASETTEGNESPHSLLNEMEFEIFKLLSEGYKPAEIAPSFNLSTTSINKYSLSIRSKLNISRSAELTKLAIKHGIIDLD